MNSLFRTAMLLAAGAALGILASQCLDVHRPGPPNPRSTSQHTGPSIEQIRALSALVTNQVQVADVQITRIRGRTGSVQAALIVKGDFLLSVDLNQARFEAVDERARTAVLVLPGPEVLSERLDHHKTRIFAVQESGLWRLAPGDEAKLAVLEEAFREAQAMLRAVSAEPQLRGRARQQAHAVLGAFMSAVGWTVQIRWENP